VRSAFFCIETHTNNFFIIGFLSPFVIYFEAHVRRLQLASTLNRDHCFLRWLHGISQSYEDLSPLKLFLLFFFVFR